MAPTDGEPSKGSQRVGPPFGTRVLPTKEQSNNEDNSKNWKFLNSRLPRRKYSYGKYQPHDRRLSGSRLATSNEDSGEPVQRNWDEISADTKPKHSLIPKPGGAPRFLDRKEPCKTYQNHAPIKAAQGQRVQIVNVNLSPKNPDFPTNTQADIKSLAAAKPIPNLTPIYQRIEGPLPLTDWFIESMEEYLARIPSNALSTQPQGVINSSHLRESMVENEILNYVTSNSLEEADTSSINDNSNVDTTTSNNYNFPNNNITKWMTGDISYNADEDSALKEKATVILQTVSKRSGLGVITIKGTDPPSSDGQTSTDHKCSKASTALRWVKGDKTYQYPSAATQGNTVCFYQHKKVPSYVDCMSEILQKTTNFETSAAENDIRDNLSQRDGLEHIEEISSYMDDKSDSHFNTPSETHSALTMDPLASDVNMTVPATTWISETPQQPKEEIVHTEESLQTNLRLSTQNNQELLNVDVPHQRSLFCQMQHMMYHDRNTSSSKDTIKSNSPLRFGKIYHFCRGKWSKVFKGGKWSIFNQKRSRDRDITNIRRIICGEDVETQTCLLLFKDTGTLPVFKDQISLAMNTSLRMHSWLMHYNKLCPDSTVPSLRKDQTSMAINTSLRMHSWLMNYNKLFQVPKSFTENVRQQQQYISRQPSMVPFLTNNNNRSLQFLKKTCSVWTTAGPEMRRWSTPVRKPTCSAATSTTPNVVQSKDVFTSMEFFCPLCDEKKYDNSAFGFPEMLKRRNMTECSTYTQELCGPYCRSPCLLIKYQEHPSVSPLNKSQIKCDCVIKSSSHSAHSNTLTQTLSAVPQIENSNKKLASESRFSNTFSLKSVSEEKSTLSTKAVENQNKKASKTSSTVEGPLNRSHNSTSVFLQAVAAAVSPIFATDLDIPIATASTIYTAMDMNKLNSSRIDSFERPPILKTSATSKTSLCKEERSVTTDPRELALSFADMNLVSISSEVMGPKRGEATNTSPIASGFQSAIQTDQIAVPMFDILPEKKSTGVYTENLVAAQSIALEVTPVRLLMLRDVKTGSFKEDSQERMSAATSVSANATETSQCKLERKKFPDYTLVILSEADSSDETIHETCSVGVATKSLCMDSFTRQNEATTSRISESSNQTCSTFTNTVSLPRTSVFIDNPQLENSSVATFIKDVTQPVRSALVTTTNSLDDSAKNMQTKETQDIRIRLNTGQGTSKTRVGHFKVQVPSTVVNNVTTFDQSTSDAKTTHVMSQAVQWQEDDFFVRNYIFNEPKRQMCSVFNNTILSAKESQCVANHQPEKLSISTLTEDVIPPHNSVLASTSKTLESKAKTCSQETQDIRIRLNSGQGTSKSCVATKSFKVQVASEMINNVKRFDRSTSNAKTNVSQEVQWQADDLVVNNYIFDNDDKDFRFIVQKDDTSPKSQLVKNIFKTEEESYTYSIIGKTSLTPNKNTMNASTSHEVRQKSAASSAVNLIHPTSCKDVQIQYAHEDSFLEMQSKISASPVKLMQDDSSAKSVGIDCGTQHMVLKPEFIRSEKSVRSQLITVFTLCSSYKDIATQYSRTMDQSTFTNLPEVSNQLVNNQEAQPPVTTQTQLEYTNFVKPGLLSTPRVESYRRDVYPTYKEADHIPSCFPTTMPTPKTLSRNSNLLSDQQEKSIILSRLLDSSWQNSCNTGSSSLNAAKWVRGCGVTIDNEELRDDQFQLLLDFEKQFPMDHETLNQPFAERPSFLTSGWKDNTGMIPKTSVSRIMEGCSFSSIALNEARELKNNTNSLDDILTAAHFPKRDQYNKSPDAHEKKLQLKGRKLQVKPENCDAATEPLLPQMVQAPCVTPVTIVKSASLFTSRVILPRGICSEHLFQSCTDCVYVYDKPKCIVHHKAVIDVAIQHNPSQKDVELEVKKEHAVDEYIGTSTSASVSNKCIGCQHSEPQCFPTTIGSIHDAVSGQTVVNNIDEDIPVLETPQRASLSFAITSKREANDTSIEDIMPFVAAYVKVPETLSQNVGPAVLEVDNHTIGNNKPRQEIHCVDEASERIQKFTDDQRIPSPLHLPNIGIRNRISILGESPGTVCPARTQDNKVFMPGYIQQKTLHQAESYEMRPNKFDISERVHNTLAKAPTERTRLMSPTLYRTLYEEVEKKSLTKPDSQADDLTNITHFSPEDDSSIGMPPKTTVSEESNEIKDLVADIISPQQFGENAESFKNTETLLREAQDNVASQLYPSCLTKVLRPVQMSPNIIKETTHDSVAGNSNSPVGSCYYHILTRRIRRVKESIKKHAAKDLSDRDRMILREIELAGVMAPQTTPRSSVGPNDGLQLTLPSSPSSIKISSCFSNSLNICGSDKTNLNAVYTTLAAIEGRLRRLKRNLPD